MSVDKQLSNFSNKPFKTLLIWGVGLTLIGGGISLVSTGMSFFTGAAKVAEKEFNAEAMLRKYEWFKDAANEIRKKKADVTMYESKIERFESLGGLDRTDREKLMVWEQELLGVRASLNGLVAEYNSQSSKFNWSVFDTNESVPTFFETN